jgi:hypothetical protein
VATDAATGVVAAGATDAAPSVATGPRFDGGFPPFPWSTAQRGPPDPHVVAMTAEARSTIAAIAARLTAWVDRDNPPDRNGKRPAKTMLFSLPPVPSTVPTGIAVQTGKADWKDWTKIPFEITEPQHYQYEVKAAKDGQSADVLAHGDLNGDGKQSLFGLHVVIIGATGSLLVSPNILEESPEE